MPAKKRQKKIHSKARARISIDAIEEALLFVECDSTVKEREEVWQTIMRTQAVLHKAMMQIISQYPNTEPVLRKIYLVSYVAADSLFDKPLNIITDSTLTIISMRNVRAFKEQDGYSGEHYLMDWILEVTKKAGMDQDGQTFFPMTFELKNIMDALGASV